MKTIANTVIINSQNVKSEHLLTVIITLVFKEGSSVSAWMSSTKFANTGLPKQPLDDLKSLRHRLAELHACIIQVDILISKNQALQILYLKHCVYTT